VSNGLKGFPEAIESAFPQTQVQTCIVHLVRASLQYVSWKLRKAVAADLRRIYTAPTAGAAAEELEMGQDASGDQSDLAPELAADHAVFRVCAGHLEGDLYDQCR
jgi:putative transposase